MLMKHEKKKLVVLFSEIVNFGIILTFDFFFGGGYKLREGKEML